MQTSEQTAFSANNEPTDLTVRATERAGERSSDAEQKPLLVIRARRGFNPIPIRELLQFRDLLLTLAQRDVKLRYRQTALGAIWVVIQPLIAAGIFTFVFGKVAKLSSDGVPYFAFTFAGMLGWNIFANTITKASGSLTGNSGLISKVYFPRMILPLSTSFGVLVDFLVAMILMVAVLVIYRIPPTLALLALPVCVVIALMLALGIGMYFASLMVSYRDVQYVTPVLTQFLLYASPVAYAASSVPHALRGFYSYNPIVGMLEAFRWSLLGTPISSWGTIAYSAAFAVVVFVLGALAFQKMERRFADVI